MTATRPVTGTRLAGWASKLARWIPTPSSRPSWLAHSPSPRAWVPFPDDFLDWDSEWSRCGRLVQWIRRQHARPRERAIRGRFGASRGGAPWNHHRTDDLAVGAAVEADVAAQRARAEVRMTANQPVTGTRLAGWASKLARWIRRPARDPRGSLTVHRLEPGFPSRTIFGSGFGVVVASVWCMVRRQHARPRERAIRDRQPSTMSYAVSLRIARYPTRSRLVDSTVCTRLMALVLQRETRRVLRMSGSASDSLDLRVPGNRAVSWLIAPVQRGLSQA